MEQPVRKAWTMKHPVLARVFAIVLAIMSLILLFGGVKNIQETKEENADRLRYEKNYSGRIENYIELSAQLENSISYERAWAELEKIVEQHEDDASQHKTDLALYTAEKGGNTMGANMIWEAIPEIKGGKQQLEIAKQELANQEAQLNTVLENEAIIRAAAAIVSGGEATSQQLINELQAAVKELEKLSQPSPSPEVSPSPELTVTPSPSPEAEVSPSPSPELTVTPSPTPEAEVSPSPSPELTVTPSPNPEAEVSSSPSPETEPSSTPAASVEATASPSPTSQDSEQALQLRTKGIIEPKKMQKALSPVVRYAAVDNMGYDIQQAQAIWASIQAMIPEANSLVASIDTLNDYPGFEAITVPDIFQYIASITSNEEAIALANALIEFLSGVDNAFEYANSILSPMMQILDNKEATLAALAEGKAQLEAGEKALQMGEAQAMGALADIWYNLGELEKKKAELETERDRLNEEASVLSKQLLDAEALQELENNHISAKLLLTSVKQVNDMFEESGDLVASANSYLEDYKQETVNLQKGRMIVSILAIIGGLAGLIGVPAAYELIRKRAWLIAPVVICIICAATAETVYYRAVHEMWYIGLFTAILCALHLLAVLPKEKKPAVVTET